MGPPGKSKLYARISLISTLSSYPPSWIQKHIHTIPGPEKRDAILPRCLSFPKSR